MPELISRLAALCRDNLLPEKILLAPSLAIGHQIADAVAQSGTPWVNLRVETIRTLSDAVAGFGIARDGLTVLSRAQALAIIERVCDRVLDDTSYFAALKDRPGLHRAIQKSIDDLRHARVAIDAKAFEDPRKGEDLARIVAAYDEELIERRFTDRFGVLQRAIREAKRRAAIWFVVDGIELTKSEQQFLDIIAGDFQTGRAEARPHSCSFRKALGEENEIRGVFRSILERRETLDQSEIVYTARDPYLPLAFELAAENDIPCTFAEGIPAHFTRPGQAALAFLRWIGEGWHAAELRPIAGGRIARVLRRAAIGWGRDRYLPRIDALEPDEARDEARAFVERLLTITNPIADSLDMTSASRAAAAFVRTTRVSNEIDVMVREALFRMFSELAAIDLPHPAHVAERLADAVRNLHVAASNPRPGHLHVAPVRAGAWSARLRMFVVGLDEERHPGGSFQDPIILDSEREAIGIPITGDRPQRLADQFRSLLGRAASREITLSWSSLRISDRREQFPSTAMLEAFRQTKSAATYEDLVDAATEDRFVDPTPLSGSDWWLYRRFVDRETNLTDALHLAWPSLDAGARAISARESDAITAYDGKISAPAEELDPRRNGRTYSASRLEKLAGCPFRYFVEHILKISPLEDIVFDPDRWLEPNEFGSLAHEVFEATMNELGAQQRRPSVDFLPRMTEIAEEHLKEWKEEVPPPSETAYLRRERDLVRICEVFLRTEAKASADVSPVEFEYEFEDIDLPVGGGRSIKLRGKVDRIDRDEKRGEWHVWDYKTGLVRDFDGNWSLRCGTKMQHALYARAVEAKLGGRVTKSGYLFPTPRGRGARIEKQCTDSDLRRALNLISDVVASGWFPHAEKCEYCEFQAACGGLERAANQTMAKATANPDEPTVRAWRELQEIE